MSRLSDRDALCPGGDIITAIVRALDEHRRVHGLTRRLGMRHHPSVELVQIVVVTPDVVAHVAGSAR